MRDGIRRQLSFANVTSMLALTVALGGTSYAAVTLPKNSIGSTQIKKGTIVGSDIHSNAITSKKVKDKSLKAVDFAAGQLPAGAKGDTGAQGPKGDTGAFGTVTAQFSQATVDLADGVKQSYNAFCLPGQQAIGGGGRGDAEDSEETSMTSSRPAVSAANTEPPPAGTGFTGWRITVTNTTGGATTGIRPEVWVSCVPAPS